MTRKTLIRKTTIPYLFLTRQERLVIWQRARGMWKNRTPDPIKELEKVRKGWDRDLPPLT